MILFAGLLGFIVGSVLMYVALACFHEDEG